MLNNLTDLEIIEAYRKKGDREAIGEIFKRYGRFVFLVSLKHLGDEEKAKDASMQIFEDLFRDLKKHEIRNFKSWLYTVTKNHCLLQLRSQQQFKKMAIELKKDSEGIMESGYLLHPVDDPEKKMNELEDAILSLNKEQRTCIELFYLKKKCYREIAEATGNSYNEVKSHIQNGKRNLRIFLDRQHER